MSRSCGVALAVVGALVPGLWAQGRVIIDPPFMPPRPGPGSTTLVLRALRVGAEITDGVAVVTVEQSFRNPLNVQLEGTYIIPLPDDVAVGDFSMTVGGKTLHGEVLDANAARQTYEDIVRRSRDPGLLEYLGTRLFRARIFPIPPSGVVDVRLQYSQTLAEQDGLGLFRHPLRGEPGGSGALEQLAVNVKLRSTAPLAAVFSPSHECAISRHGEHEATVSHEAVRVLPDRDFLLYYQRSTDAIGLSLLTYHAPGEPGTFCLRLSPRIDAPDAETQPKDIAFVVDTSGSMTGPKIEQTRRALRFCLNSLNPADRFNIYAFSSEVHPFRDSLVPAAGDVRAAALRYVDELRALGGTNIDGALSAAVQDAPSDDGRVYLVVFMTDGQPTVGVTDVDQIRTRVLQKNRRQARIHVLGVGSDVNTHLLDKLAEATRGFRDYCTENEDLELKLSAFVQRLSSPVMTDLRLRLEGVRAFDVYPQELPDLFRGNDLVVMGRFDGSGTATVRLEGLVAGRTKTIERQVVFPAQQAGSDFLPRLWANRKVAYLLDQIRLHGSNRELVDEVVRLAKRYGIVTPYTSALILEENVHTGGGGRPTYIEERLRERIRQPGEKEEKKLEAARQVMGSRGSEPAKSGAVAVEAARDLAKQQDAAVAPPALAEAGQPVIRHVSDKVFLMIDGRWTDMAWDGQQTPRQVKVFSDEYFKLLEEKPELQKFFAIGERVLVILGGEVYETVPSGS